MIVKNLHAPLLPAFPLLLLLLALSTVFPFGNERGHFYRPGHHDHLTKIHLVLAANRSPAHNFLGFFRQTLDADGAPTYDVYNRFPIGGYLLIKLANQPPGATPKPPTASNPAHSAIRARIAILRLAGSEGRDG